MKASEIFSQPSVVACQGIRGANSETACRYMFQQPDIMFMESFSAVFTAVESGLCQYGVLPIENSTHGSVTAVYDLMSKHKFSIVRAVKVSISHSLLALPSSKLSDIKEIISHEQAIGQCSEFLKDHRGIKITACQNTALAAKLVCESGRNDLAAICSPDCVEIYNLKSLAHNIQDAENNCTRFICIRKTPISYNGADKISLMLSLPNRPNSLYEILSEFAKLNINLTKIESRPIIGTDFEFLFYIDFDASLADPKISALMDNLGKKLSVFTVLGNYSTVQPKAGYDLTSRKQLATLIFTSLEPPAASR